ncbi:DUF6875 domain-containing protein [Streptomyces sp. NPDC005322]|uniref:DUF6875 domain-containing protein n=1 Tax=Streptomyces sp. NPDC005322 TaxID=3157032 RepID=UPI0033B98570
MSLTSNDSFEIVRQPDSEAELCVLTESVEWLHSFLTRSHPELGRKGSVCPYMEQSLKLGRTAISLVDVGGSRGRQRLESIARSALERLGQKGDRDDIYNTFVMLPVGDDVDRRRNLVVEVQSALKPEAVAAGKMVGEFFPGHPMRGIHNQAFRPLVSPHPLLAVRAMVVTDVLFLALPEIPARDRLSYLDVWNSRFAELDASPWQHAYRAAKDLAEKEIS